MGGRRAFPILVRLFPFSFTTPFLVDIVQLDRGVEYITVAPVSDFRLRERAGSRGPVSLQWSAADEVAPGADLGGDALLLRQLLAHALSEENGSLVES
jgi:hypothetical protein